MVQQGHLGFGRTVAWSPDGKVIASSGWDLNIILWDVKMGRTIRIIRGHEKYIETLAWSPDGKLIASGSEDDTVKIWDVSSGKLIRTLKPAKGTVNSLKWSYHGYLIAGCRRGIKLFNTANWFDVRVIDIPVNFNEVVLSPDNKLFAVSEKMEKIKIFNISSGDLVRTVQVRHGFVLRWSPDGSRFATYDLDQVVVISIQTGKIETKLEIDEKLSVSALDWSPDGRYLAYNGELSSGSFTVWDLYEDKKVFFSKHKPEFIAWSPDNQYVATIEDAGYALTYVRIFNINSKVEYKKLGGYISGYSNMQGLDNSDRLMLKSGNNIYQWEPAAAGQMTPKLLNIPLKEEPYVTWSPNGRYLAYSEFNDYTISIWDDQQKKVIHRLKATSKNVENSAWSPDGQRLAAGGTSSVIRVWDILTGNKIFDLSSGYFDSLDWSPDGRLLAAGGRYDNNIKIWRMSDGKKVRTLNKHRHWIDNVTWSPDGKLLASGSRDCSVKIWDLNEANPLKHTLLYTNFTAGELAALAWSPDSKIIAAGGDAGYIKLWDIKSGILLSTLEGHYSGVISLTWKDKRIFSNGEDGTIKVWNPHEEKLTATLYNLQKAIVVVTPQGYFAGTGNYHDYIHFVEGLNVFTLDQVANKFYRPELVQLALTGETISNFETIDKIIRNEPAPLLEIISPENHFITNKNSVLLETKIKDLGGGIGDVYVYSNGSLVSTQSRGKIIRINAGKQTIKFKVPLSEGKNDMKVIAFNKNNTISSTSDEIIVTCDYKFNAPSLYALIIGINDHKNESLNLRYAVSDANLFAETLRLYSAPLFKKVSISLLTQPGQTTRESIEQSFELFSKTMKANDYFVFYNASHGHLVALNNRNYRYYLVTSNVIFLDPMNLERDAISQNKLVNYIGNIPAQNKVIVLDTCHSGEAGRVIQFAMANMHKIYSRDLSMATAMELIRIASGASVFTAAQDVEAALEGYKGHGLFTYLLVEGLRGKADLNNDQFVTLSELKAQVEMDVIELSRKDFRRIQVPYINIGTLDLPITKKEQK